jgi:hypothetical protein
MYTGEELDDRIEMIRAKILNAIIPFTSEVDWNDLVDPSKMDSVDQINKTVDKLVNQINNFNK